MQWNAAQVSRDLRRHAFGEALPPSVEHRLGPRRDRCGGPTEGADATSTHMPLQHIASRWRVIACIQAFDFLIFVLMVLQWCEAFAQATTWARWALQLIVAVLAACAIHCVFQCFRLYDFAVLKCGRDAVTRAFGAGVVSSSVFVAPLLSQPDRLYDLGTALGLVAAGLAGVALLRLAFAWLVAALHRADALVLKIYIVADSIAAAASLTSELESGPGKRVIGTLDLSSQNGSVETALEVALEFLRNNPVDIVILKLPLSKPHRLMETARVLSGCPCPVLLYPSLEDGIDIALRSSLRSTARSDGLGNVIMFKISDRPLAGWCWVRKDIQDWVLAILLLAITSPVFVAIAVAIKMSDPGPVFFRQQRRGYAGSTFRIIKFRTMKVLDDPLDTASFKLTTRNDRRVSPIGRFLRKTSLDELPQLLNVLKGDMWIIGPRPHPLLAQAGGMLYPAAVKGYAARYRIKPGITGWAQVCGWRGPTDTIEQLNKRIEHDLYYIDNWSSSLDVTILIRTLGCFFGHQNAF